MATLQVRELRTSDIPLITNYWLDSSPEFLTGMGVDLSKMPSAAQWKESLNKQLSQPIPEKQSYCVIWEVDGIPSGHSNINKIQFGEEAYMHLHLWHNSNRIKGFGTQFVRLSLPFFFDHYLLKTLYCEPYARNPAPNKTLEKVGFQKVKEYVTIPGWLNFEQPVQLWQLTREQYLQLL
ncbi:MAG TPA: N-acetyltransferase [Saprospirales bacterium]|nr:N-acetyltransferase [Saprospirales bacterium]